jgi:hypothetical protein
MVDWSLVDIAQVWQQANEEAYKSFSAIFEQLQDAEEHVSPASAAAFDQLYQSTIVTNIVKICSEQELNIERSDAETLTEVMQLSVTSKINDSV